MMPALKNQRHEKFVLALFEGKTATEAYEQAGYRPCRKNAARLTTFDDIKARLGELQAEAAKDTAVTVESLLRELEDARSKATDNNQLAAATTAIMGKAKLAGFLRDKVEITNGDPFENCESMDAIADRMAFDLGDGLLLNPEDHAGFVRLVTDWFEQGHAAMKEYLAGCGAKPVNGRPWVIEANSPADRRDKEINHRHRRLTHGNSQR